jgi:hydroxypyruvate isomerase
LPPSSFTFPYEFDRAALAEVVLTSGLDVVLFNLPAGDWAAGERGIACHPRRIAEFQDGVGLAIEYAKLLACPRLNCLAGIAPGGVSPEKARETLVENLRFAAAVTRAPASSCSRTAQYPRHARLPGQPPARPPWH